MKTLFERLKDKEKLHYFAEKFPDFANEIYDSLYRCNIPGQLTINEACYLVYNVYDKPLTLGHLQNLFHDL